jgi:amino acid adenylation domain-containing protein
MTSTPSITSAERLLKLARARLQSSSATAPIEPVERGGALPLSFAQQRLWFLEQLGGLGDTYHIPTQMRLGGDVDRAALRRALDAIVERHEALRTTFVKVEAEPVQHIAPPGGFHLVEHDLGDHPDAAAELRRLTAEESGALFDLEKGPLIRGRLIRLAADDHVLLLTMHHIVSDGWSMEVLTRELGTLYDAFRRGGPNPLPPLPVQYADYAAWQRKWVDGEVLREQAEYWKTTLAGAPELLELPTDRPRPARQDYAGAMVGIDLGEELSAGLRTLSQGHGTTLFMTLLAGWAAVLGRLSGQEDVVIGTPSANRGRMEIEGLIGFFVNTLALRVDLSGSPTVAELLEQVRKRSLGAQHRQDIPFEQVVDLVQPARSMAHTPLFQVTFAWQSASEGRPEHPDAGPGGVGAAARATAKFDLSLTLGEAGGRIVGAATYATALFEQATVERYLGYLRRVLEAMVADDRRAVDVLPLLPEPELRLLDEWSRSGETPDAAVGCVHELFAEQAARTPDAVALVYGDESLTYAELHRRSNALARRLAALGVGPEVRVGICVERGVEMVVGLLGILEAGGAYVPLDPQYPADRLAYMLADAGATLLLTQERLRDRLPAFDGDVVLLDSDGGTVDDASSHAVPRTASPENLVYVIYTSGSTGLPKGTEVPHRAIPGFFRGAGYARFGEGAVVLQHSAVSWDALTLELWPALLSGGTCVLYPGQTSEPAVLGEQVRRHGVNTLWLTAAYFNLIVDTAPEILEGVTQVMTGGEAVSVPHMRRALELNPRLRLVNGYGPSETTVFATCHPVSAGFDDASVPLGRPVGDRRVYLLDGRFGAVPLGAAGEVCIGGPAVARGYLGRPGLTAERFIPDPFGEPGARLYRSGDRARWRAEGELEFVGRVDFQVKIRGFRVEMGEIEARLLEHPQVRETVVVAREDAGDRRLVAYYTGDAALGVEQLSAHLSEVLPKHMVPAAYVRLEALPLTPHGKVDRQALPAPEGDAFARRGYEAPVDETEEALAEIWSEVLGVERIGRHDHFFELGGHSLLATRLVLRIQRNLDVDVTLRDVFEKPVLSTFAQHVVHKVLAQFDPEELARLGALLDGDSLPG